MKNILKFCLAITFLVAMSVVFPLARNVLGFIYLTFIPGIVLLRVLKLSRLATIEKIMVSVGLSISFLMFVGLLINWLYPLAGISKPLSTLPILVTITVLLAILCGIGYKVDKKEFLLPLNLKGIPLSSLILLCLPLLSMIGAIWVSIYGNNFLLIMMITIISGLVILITFSRKYISPEVYPLVLFCFAIALLFHVSLISMYLYGFDIHLEYHFFKLTESSFQWNAATPSRFNAMLSVTILPTIYASVLNLEGDWVFKIVYPIIFSFVPLVLYHIYQGQRIGKLGAFLSVFFLMSNYVFYNEMLGLARQMIAELFFVLLIFLLLEKKLDPTKNSLLFIVFSAALVVSHYATSYLYMFFILIVLVLSYLTKNRTRNLNLISVLIFATLVSSWYIYMSASAPMVDLLYVFTEMFRGIFYDFFNPSTREQNVLIGVGLGGSAGSLEHEVGRIMYYATEVLIIIGVMKLLIERKRSKFSLEYVQMSLISVFLILISMILPYFAASLNMTRIYHISLFILAPMCILGWKTLFSITSVKKSFAKKLSVPFLTLTLLIPYFLFNTGIIYEVTGDIPSSKSLSIYRMDKAILYDAYTTEREVYSAGWFSEHANNASIVYCDLIASLHVLSSYGSIPLERTQVLSNQTDIWAGYVYLRTLNVVDREMRGLGGGVRGGDLWNATEISPQLNNLNKIYSNGGSDIYTDLHLKP